MALKWEYLRMKWSGVGFSFGAASEVFVTVSDPSIGIPPDTRMPIEYFQKLVERIGDEGWEMVNSYGYYMGGNKVPDYHFAWFKRPKQPRVANIPSAA